MFYFAKVGKKMGRSKGCCASGRDESTSGRKNVMSGRKVEWGVGGGAELHPLVVWCVGECGIMVDRTDEQWWKNYFRWWCAAG